jgi:NAD(P)-dependent dehydrogenase (short-subunit alcohol dehydrogenase family)
VKKLEGKIALVAGSSRSIGKAIAIALAQEGAKLVLAARTVEGLERTAAAVYMACQPPDVNVLELVQLPRQQPYLGRAWAV